MVSVFLRLRRTLRRIAPWGLMVTRGATRSTHTTSRNLAMPRSVDPLQAAAVALTPMADPDQQPLEMQIEYRSPCIAW
jgi:hypothetical protein